MMGYPERTLYYWARKYSSALPSAGRYAELPRTVIISIVAFKLFDCAEYHSEFQPLEVTRHTPLSDRMSLLYFELPKLPQTVTADNGLELWLSLFSAKTEEDLTSLESMGVPEVKEAIKAYRSITVTQEFRERERLRAKARHDEAQALYNRDHQTKLEIAKNALAMNMTIDDIIKLTGLTREEIEGLRNNSNS